MDGNDMAAIAMVALVCHGYDLRQVQQCVCTWCEAGQHIHIDAQMEPEADVVQLIFTKVELAEE